MRIKCIAAGLVAAGTTLSWAAMGAQATPAGGASSLSGVAETSVEKVAQRCWWRGGTRYCRKTKRTRYYGYRSPSGYGPDAYRTGSSRWWSEMDREDRGGRGNRP